MASEPTPDVPPHHAELAHFVAAAIAAMAIVPLVACVLGLGDEPGTENWQNWLLGLVTVAAFYLLAIAFSHLGEAWRGQGGAPAARWSTMLKIAVDLAVAGVAIALVTRGPASRLLLAGLGDALPGLIAAAGVSALITIYSRWRQTPASVSDGNSQAPRGYFHILIGLLLVGGLIACELQPLPRIIPKFDTPVGLKVLVSHPRYDAERGNEGL